MKVTNISNIGALYLKQENGRHVFLGTCFCFSSPEIFVTASHCVKNYPPSSIYINHFGGAGDELMSVAKKIENSSEGDIALIITESPKAKWVKPFERVQYGANYGEEICAIGYPQDLMGSIPDKATLRFFSGNIQRPFLYSRPNGKKYSAYELSFAAPPGLSGGPVFLKNEPSTVIGVITENFDTNTFYDEFEETTGASTKTTIYRKVITYGVAANMLYLADIFEKYVGRDIPAKVEFDNE